MTMKRLSLGLLMTILVAGAIAPAMINQNAFAIVETSITLDGIDIDRTADEMTVYFNPITEEGTVTYDVTIADDDFVYSLTIAGGVTKSNGVPVVIQPDIQDINIKAISVIEPSSVL